MVSSNVTSSHTELMADFDKIKGEKPAEQIEYISAIESEASYLSGLLQAFAL